MTVARPALVLEVRHVDTSYGPVQALFDVSVEVAAGQVVSVLGGNASGKSTLIRTVLGLVQPSRGEVLLDGVRVDGRSTPEIVGRGVGSIPESRRLFADMTVEENVRLGLYARRGEARHTLDERVEAALSLFPQVSARRRQLAGTLSGGEQQLVAMARAWVREPRIMCIDEPSMGLSPLYVDRVYEVLEGWKRQGVTILMVEQSANRALELADWAYVLANGHLVLQGPASELAHDPAVRAAYLGGP